MAFKIMKIRIGKRPAGEADHPKLHALPMFASLATKAERDAAAEAKCRGPWFYDVDHGHDYDITASSLGVAWNSPAGEQWACRIMDEAMADELLADSIYGPRCQVITQAEFEAYHDQHAQARVRDEQHDPGVIEGMNAEIAALDVLIAADPADASLATRRTAVLAKLAKAVDPDDPEPGVRKNTQRRWADHKQRLGLTRVGDIKDA